MPTHSDLKNFEQYKSDIENFEYKLWIYIQPCCACLFFFPLNALWNIPLIFFISFFNPSLIELFVWLTIENYDIVKIFKNRPKSTATALFGLKTLEIQDCDENWFYWMGISIWHLYQPRSLNFIDFLKN